MLFIDEITDIDKFKKIYKTKNKLFIKLQKNNLIKINEIIYRLTYFYMKTFNKNIKKIINIEEDGLKLNVLYFITDKKVEINKEKNLEKNNKKVDKSNKKLDKNIIINTKKILIKNKEINIRIYKNILNKIKSKIKNKLNIKKEKSRCLKLIKIIKLIKKYKIKNVILSNSLYNDDKVKDYFIDNKINLIQGKFLYESLLYKIIEQISVIQKTKIEKYEISVLINKKTDIRVSNIVKLAKKCKIINILTKNVKQYKKLENYLKNEYGIILNVTTNIEKSLINSNIIINLDYLFDEFRQLNLPREAIIFNVKNNIKIYSSFFEGINITDYSIYLPEKYNKIIKSLESINPTFLYEAIIIEENLIQNEIERKINVDKIKIKYFIGNNGKIRGMEFLKVNRIKNKQEKELKDLTKKYNNRNIVPLVKNQT